jgi:2-oxoglutarate ferredoxin oxidoreductase subunit gamma
VERSVVIAGFGGQGILFAGHVLAEAANLEGREVLWIPSYGPEMRGGTASCTVIVGDEPIGSPVVDRTDAAIVMNPPSLDKFGPLVRPGGLLVVDASLVEAASGRDDIDELRVSCVDLGGSGADERLGSIVALGVVVERLGIVAPEAIRAALASIIGPRHPEVVEADLAAFEAGRRAACPSVDGEIPLKMRT